MWYLPTRESERTKVLWHLISFKLSAKLLNCISNPNFFCVELFLISLAYFEDKGAKYYFWIVHIFTNSFEKIMTRNNDESCRFDRYRSKLITKYSHKNFAPGPISSQFVALSSEDITIPHIPSDYFHCARQEIDNPISKRIHSDFNLISLRVGITYIMFSIFKSQSFCHSLWYRLSILSW